MTSHERGKKLQDIMFSMDLAHRRKICLMTVQVVKTVNVKTMKMALMNVAIMAKVTVLDLYRVSDDFLCGLSVKCLA